MTTFLHSLALTSHSSALTDFRFTVNPIKMSTEKDHLTIT